MKLLCRLLLLCLFVWGSVFAQTSAPVINASSCDKPGYPSASKRLEEEGTVQLKFLVDVNGKVIESVVEKSSGFRRLDEAARQGLSKCAFKPPTKDGVALQSWASMKYTWRLENPLCVGSDVSKWTSCQGTLATPSGGLSVVEYAAGKKNGAGIEYDSTGKVIRAGIFVGENLVSEQKLDPKLYPFIALLPANSANQSVNMAAVQPDISSSNLPACPSSGYFHNCFGNYTYDGLKYVGEWKENKWNGRGTLSFHSGTKYVGEFKDDKYSGQGTYTSASGNKYVGEFKDGKWNGLGTFTYTSGNKYVGEFKDDKLNGQGTLFAPNGSIINQGIWADNKFVRSDPVVLSDLQNTQTTSYAQLIRMKIKPNITFTEEVAGNPKAEVEVHISADGTILGRKLLSSSGIKSWDDAVLKAIDKTKLIPKDIDGKVPPILEISFRPKY